ncbi:hypothetical protein ACFLZP_02345 [Patescibacteria group bacterium]
MRKKACLKKQGFWFLENAWEVKMILIKRKKITITSLTLLLILSISSFLLNRYQPYFFRREKIGQIPTLKKETLSLFLKTDQRKYLLKQTKFSSVYDLHSLEESFKKRVMETAFFETPQALFFQEEEKLKMYDLATKKNRSLKLPDQVSKLNLSRWAFHLAAIDQNLALISFYENGGRHRSFFYDLKQKTYSPLDAFQGNCGLPRCSIPKLILPLEKELIVSQGWGDSCCSQDKYYSYSLVDHAKQLLVETDNGCCDENEEEVGHYKNWLVLASHDYWFDQASPDEGNTFSNLSAYDFKTKKGLVLLDSQSFPKNISSIWIQEGIVYLKPESHPEDESQGCYAYDLEKRTLTSKITPPSKKTTEAEFQNFLKAHREYLSLEKDSQTITKLRAPLKSEIEFVKGTDEDGRLLEFLSRQQWSRLDNNDGKREVHYHFVETPSLTNSSGHWLTFSVLKKTGFLTDHHKDEVQKGLLNLKNGKLFKLKKKFLL